jgi:hypothetical protein
LHERKYAAHPVGLRHIARMDDNVRLVHCVSHSTE